MGLKWVKRESVWREEVEGDERGERGERDKGVKGYEVEGGGRRWACGIGTDSTLTTRSSGK